MRSALHSIYSSSLYEITEKIMRCFSITSNGSTFATMRRNVSPEPNE